MGSKSGTCRKCSVLLAIGTYVVPAAAAAQSSPIDRIDAIERQIRGLQSELQQLKGELGLAKQQLRQSRSEAQRAQDQLREAREAAERARQDALRARLQRLEPNRLWHRYRRPVRLLRPPPRQRGSSSACPRGDRPSPRRMAGCLSPLAGLPSLTWAVTSRT